MAIHSHLQIKTPPAACSRPTGYAKDSKVAACACDKSPQAARGVGDVDYDMAGAVAALGIIATAGPVGA